MIQDLDFTLYKNRLQVKAFRFRNEDGTYFDFSDSTIRMDIYRDGPDENPTSVNGVITIETADVSFSISPMITSNVGSFEYVILQVKESDNIPLIRGNIVINEYVPFSDSIEQYISAELPEGLTLSEKFINQKIRYWRLFLQEAYNVKDENLNVDSAWPVLVNVLIGKLIAYDALVTAIKGNLFSVFNATSNYQSNSSSTTNGDVKSITTGPTQVEFYASGETVNSVIKSVTSNSENGKSILSQMAEDLCGLASKLTLKLPMCKAGNVVMVFKNVKKTNTYINKDISRG